MEEAESARKAQVIEGMPFIYGLVKGKLDHCRLARRRRGRPRSSLNHQDAKISSHRLSRERTDEPGELLGYEEDHADLEELERLERLSYEPALEGDKLEEHRLTQVTNFSI